MPKLWEDTVENHRRAVREAVLDAVESVLDEHGYRGLTMSRVAATSGIGRATLYKYFPDIDSVLLAHHRRHVAGHLEQLARLRDEADSPAHGLRAVMLAFARILFHRRRHARDDVFAMLHSKEETAGAAGEVRGLFTDLIASARRTGDVRSDVDVSELVDYCLNALGAASGARDEAAVERLVIMTTDGLRG